MIIGDTPYPCIILFGNQDSVNRLWSEKPAPGPKKINNGAIPGHLRLPAGGWAFPVDMTGKVPSGRLGGLMDSPIVAPCAAVRRMV